MLQVARSVQADRSQLRLGWTTGCHSAGGTCISDTGDDGHCGSGGTPPSGAVSPLRSKQFRLLFLARTISTFGSFIAPVALAFAVLRLTGSTTALGLTLAARTVPQLVFLLAGGIWSDRLPRHIVMVVSSVVMGVAQALSALVLLLGLAELWHLLVMQGVWGVAFSFFFPASQGLVPQTVERSQLQQANALLRMTLNGATIGGGAIGGVLVAVVGPAVGLLVDSLTFFASAALLGAMTVAATERVQTPNFVLELKEGWREFSSRMWVWTVVLGFSVLNAAHAGGISVLAPEIARTQLGGARAYGLITAFEGAGLVLGGVAALKFKPRRPLFLGCAAVSLIVPTFVLLAVGAPLILILLGGLLMGIGIETFAIYWDTSLQHHVPERALSRVSSYDMFGSIAIIPIGQVVAGPMGEAIGISDALIVAAGVILVAVLGMLSVPDIRRLQNA